MGSSLRRVQILALPNTVVPSPSVVLDGDGRMRTRDIYSPVVPVEPRLGSIDRQGIIFFD